MSALTAQATFDVSTKTWLLCHWAHTKTKCSRRTTATWRSCKNCFQPALAQATCVHTRPLNTRAARTSNKELYHEYSATNDSFHHADIGFRAVVVECEFFY